MSKNALAAALCLAFAACAGTESPPPAAQPSGDLWSASLPDPYVAAIPSPTQLAVAFDAAPAATALARSALVAPALEGPAELSGASTPAFGIDQALAMVRLLVPPSGTPVREAGPGERAFGPASRCVVPAGEAGCPSDAVVETELLVRMGAPGSYSWTLRAHPVGAVGGWFNVYFGSVDPGEVPGSSQGRFVASLDALRVSLDPARQIAASVRGSGRLIGGFVMSSGEQAVFYRAEDLVIGDAAPVNGRLYAHRSGDGARRIRFTSIRDVIPGPGGAEFVANHVGMTSAGTVGYAIVANWNPWGGFWGDVPFTVWPGEAYLFVRSCFGPDRTPIHREVFTCPIDDTIADCVATVAATPLAGYEGGSWDACASMTGDVTATLPTSGAPAPWSENPEPGFIATPRPPGNPDEFASELAL